MGPQGAVNIIFKKDLSDPKKIEEHVQNYQEKFTSPLAAARLGYIDDIIDPSSTRQKIIKSLGIINNKLLENPWKKHDNIPM
jgi:propionyl-CoA carboxylase beta chain